MTGAGTCCSVPHCRPTIWHSVQASQYTGSRLHRFCRRNIQVGYFYRQAGTTIKSGISRPKAVQLTLLYEFDATVVSVTKQLRFHLHTFVWIADDMFVRPLAICIHHGRQ